ncbi:tetratricopeptide repeat protein [Geodermatophilus obscurus]|uniref:Tetratricopeptide TPR_4 n=1 Tax=Geodermatophilus obscurus (strain ATCC 25078 / DSM 43160 / JCM 3152 / CCUG 61914 / KCC A-0152 / KCTC 9177 / NBRC 13315 / NRRL B-3577 / G-20) TaxID=526225 RepID=D2SB35_GEOOG|nr:tetratricopeptide repeat protein [Geodermatophilus obscurus]ADB76070.1 Tetratricopeptide TPR_4 [Geodermatophilus obscurus DSM 43160]
MGLRDGTNIRTAEDIQPYAVAALGVSGADRFMTVLRSPEDLAIVFEDDDDVTERYPYQHLTLDPILDASLSRSSAVEAAALGAALTLLAARPDEGVDSAPAAFAVLLRAARAGSCPAQLNLLLLLAADVNTTPAILAAEQQQANAACPGDPTADWLVGQRQLRYDPVAPPSSDGELRSTRTPDGVATMQQLVARNPTSVAALTGLGDAYLSAAMYLADSQPFSARNFFWQARDAYDSAVQHGGRQAAAPGLARALIGLGDPEAAARLLEPLARENVAPGPLLEVLVAAQEAAGTFDRAELTARRLADLGPAAYPDARALIPVPQGTYRAATLQDTSPALSLGADRLSPFTEFVVEIPIGGGADVVDNSFIPTFREDDNLTGTYGACAEWSWRRDAVLAGHAERALEDWPEEFVGARPGFQDGCVVISGDSLRAVAERDTNGSTRTDLLTDEIADAHQNLLRWAGDLPAAREVAEKWQARRGDGSALPTVRVAEIAFLQDRFDDAAAAFDQAARRERLSDWSNDLAVFEADLGRGAALAAAGRESEAEAVLRALDRPATTGYAYQFESGSQATALEFATVSYYASLQVGDLARRAGRLSAARDDYERALSWLPLFVKSDISVDHPEVLYNNAALAHLGLRDSTRASDLAARALAADPDNPAFLMTSGFIADRQRRFGVAAEHNRAALRSDPGAYPAANDLGVQLARLGEPAAARRAFRQAIGARPDYALGWFNLGVLESSAGPVRLLSAQDALGRAYALDPTLRDRRRELLIDASVYRTALDLSKPLPPAWSFADVQRRATATSAGLLVTLGLGLGLARAAGRQGTQSAQEWLEPLHQRLQRIPGLSRLRHPAWGVAATVVTFVLAVLRRPPGVIESVAYVAGILALTAAAIGVRIVVARRNQLLAAQGTWLPSAGFGIATGAAGLPWAPLPVVKAKDADARLHLAAPLLLAVAALLLFVEAAWLRTPLTEAWALAALTMAASLLLPIDPLDGAHTGKAGVAATAGVVAGAVLVALGLP